MTRNIRLIVLIVFLCVAQRDVCSSNEIANVHFDGPSSKIDAITSYGRDPLGSYMSERAEGKLKFQPFSRGERDSCFTALYRPRVLPLPPLTAWNGASQITAIPHTKISRG